jgi:hypothetical protein
MKPPEEIQYIIRASKEKENLIQSILEGYEGLVSILATSKVTTGIEMVLSSNSTFKPELLEVLEDLAQNFQIFFQEVRL